ncbi:Endonuclease-reverse transcriptase [Popillia japonica]|uniref:Endonuclease-reverse transcriptase n=1 Tax=Popillia japonica TaxID=7064 RepID=A0AAW1IAE1_POPJA
MPQRGKTQIKILQINVGRAYAAQDMAYATARHSNKNFANKRRSRIRRPGHGICHSEATGSRHTDSVVCEPNKKRVNDNRWLKDTKVSVALLLLNRGLAVVDHSVGDGHLVLRLRGFSIVCCYISPNINMTDYQHAVDNIMDRLQDGETVVLGDINAKSPMWGAPIVDNKGTYWTEWISTKNLIVHNTGDKPTFVRGDTKSHIDVTMSTNSIAKHISNWEVLEKESLTEHKYIYFEIGGPGSGRRKPKTRKKTNWNRRKPKTRKKTNWNAFRDTMKILVQGNQKTSLTGRRKSASLTGRECSSNPASAQDLHRDWQFETAAPYWWNETTRSAPRLASLKQLPLIGGTKLLQIKGKTATG